MQVEPPHGEWAWRLGLTYGIWYPDPNVDLRVLAQQFAEYIDQPANDVAVAFGRRVLRLPVDAELSDLQNRMVLPYLRELGTIGARALEAVLYYRRDALARRWPDPRNENPDAAAVTVLAGEVDEFLDAHPDLRFHLVSRAAPLSTAAPTAPGRPAAPGPLPYGVSHMGAELLAAAWMRHLGAADATATRYSRDGGIDVESAGWVAQVKNLAAGSPVPVSSIRDLVGVAAVAGKRAAMFTSGKYTRDGLVFADRAGLVLFRYDAAAGTLHPANEDARRVKAHGMG